jgi:hypothetical protein
MGRAFLMSLISNESVYIRELMTLIFYYQKSYSSFKSLDNIKQCASVMHSSRDSSLLFAVVVSYQARRKMKIGLAEQPTNIIRGSQ